MPSSLPGRVPFCSPRCLLTCPGGRRGPGCLTSSISTGTHRAAASSPRSRRSVWSGRTSMPTGGARPQSPAACERTTVPPRPFGPCMCKPRAPLDPAPRLLSPPQVLGQHAAAAGEHLRCCRAAICRVTSLGDAAYTHDAGAPAQREQRGGRRRHDVRATRVARTAALVVRRGRGPGHEFGRE